MARSQRTGWARWAPQGVVDPRSVLTEAEEAGRDGRYEESLAKHLWFHRNALRMERSLFGVRSSYALSSWVEMAAKYPPAMKALRRERQEALRRVREGGDVWDPFHDYESISEKLGESDRSVALFKWLMANNPKGAERVYHAVEDVLLKHGEIRLCDSFINVSRFDQIKRGWRVNQRMAAKEFGRDHLICAKKHFLTKACRLVALLVGNGRAIEARQVVRKSEKIFTDAKSVRALRRELEPKKEITFIATEAGFEDGLGGASNAKGSGAYHYVLFGSQKIPGPRRFSGVYFEFDGQENGGVRQVRAASANGARVKFQLKRGRTIEVSRGRLPAKAWKSFAQSVGDLFPAI